MPAALGVYVRLLRRLIRFQKTQTAQCMAGCTPQHTNHATQFAFLQKACLYMQVISIFLLPYF